MAKKRKPIENLEELIGKRKKKFVRYESSGVMSSDK